MRHLLHFTLTLFAAILLSTAPAAALVTGGSSSAYGEFIDLNGLIDADSGPLPTASGSAPSPYADTDNVLSASVPLVLSTGVIDVAASSNVDGLAGARSASASADVNNLSVGITLGLASVLSLSASEIDSDASVTGNGALSAAGSSNLVAASISVLGGAPIAIPVSPAPNTVLLNVGGIMVILNEQILTGDGVTSRGITVNAIHIALSSVLGLESGDIIISQSQAQLQAIPEPGTAMLLGTGLALCAIRARRRHTAR